MQRTFLLTLELDDVSPAALLSISDDIEADLEDNFEVVSCVPWGQSGASEQAGPPGGAGGLSGLLGQPGHSGQRGPLGQ